MKNVIEVKRLVKKYKNFVLGPIDIDIPSGCIIGLIGENGVGKTTFIKALLNIIKIDVGNIKIFRKIITFICISTKSFYSCDYYCIDHFLFLITNHLFKKRVLID